MSPDGEIYSPSQVEDLTKNVPGFAKRLESLTENEAKTLAGVNRHERRKALAEMRRRTKDI